MNVCLIDIIWAMPYLVSVNEFIIIAYTSARAVVHTTPQCLLARYSFEWLGDNIFFTAERLNHVWFYVRV